MHSESREGRGDLPRFIRLREDVKLSKDEREVPDKLLKRWDRFLLEVLDFEVALDCFENPVERRLVWACVWRALLAAFSVSSVRSSSVKLASVVFEPLENHWPNRRLLEEKNWLEKPRDLVR